MGGVRWRGVRRAEAFLAGCAAQPEPTPPESPADAALERTLTELHERAAAAHPAVHLDATTFAYALGARAGSSAGLSRL